MTRIVIIGGGPGGYEAALVGAQLGAEVTVVDCDGLGGASVLTDCVPSKTLIATAEVMTTFSSSYEELGIIVADDTPYVERAARVVGVDLGKVNRRVKRLALAQSHDITASVTRAGARVVRGRGRLVGLQAADGSRQVVVTAAEQGGAEGGDGAQLVGLDPATGAVQFQRTWRARMDASLAKLTLRDFTCGAAAACSPAGRRPARRRWRGWWR